MSRTSIIVASLPLIILFFISNSVFADETNWRPVSADEMSMTKPRVQSDADAEAIFWEVSLDKSKSGITFAKHYIRIKIFTERGHEKFSKIDIAYSQGKSIEGIAARVIKPDRDVIELNPQDIFEREVIKTGNIRIQAKSFAVPSMEVGVIFEYQYQTVFKDDSLNDERLPLQFDIPVQKLTYSIRPRSNDTVDFKTFNTEDISFYQEKDNYYRGTATNIPAFTEEPKMPPENEVRAWTLLKYGGLYSNFRWNFFGDEAVKYFKNVIKPTKEIKQKANELTAGLSSEEEKLRRIYEFTQKQIKNITFERSYSNEQREKFKLKNPTDALQSGIGDSQYIDLLFAALANAAGFNTNLVLSANRGQTFFKPEKYPVYSFVHPCCIAIYIGGNWKYFNPGTPYLAFGNLLWYEETNAMIIADNSHFWRNLPVSSPESSLAKRFGKFDLDNDGNLQGNVKIEYYGQRAIVRRQENYFDSISKREDEVQDDLKQRIKTAEVTQVEIENFDDNSKPLIYRYKIKIPNYASKTGKRIFFRPGFFEYGEKSPFISSKRIHPVYFEYAWADQDEIEYNFPSNYVLESADAPAPVIESSKTGSQIIKIKVDEEHNFLKYERNFFFGGNGNLYFEQNLYSIIKELFDTFQTADEHAITLKQK